MNESAMNGAWGKCDVFETIRLWKMIVVVVGALIGEERGIRRNNDGLLLRFADGHRDLEEGTNLCLIGVIGGDFRKVESRCQGCSIHLNSEASTPVIKQQEIRN